MKTSLLFSKTRKEIPSDHDSKNAELLTKAGCVDKLQAGVYSYLHLGTRVIQNISQIVREEMDQIGGCEIIMPCLHPKSIWEQTGRYDTMDVLFKFEGAGGSDMVLGSSHEEVVTPLGNISLQSYKDLPKAPYQINTKFRNEPRAKSGVMRGREFLMKDMYSFHEDKADMDRFYEDAVRAYFRIYERCGVGNQTFRATAPGGDFTDNTSDEFQILSKAGEDEILYCESCRYAESVEVSELSEGDKCPKCGAALQKWKSIEAGNIFKLDAKYSEACNLRFTTRDGDTKHPLMGCYGIGISRVMGAIVETFNDERGIIWPKSIAPYQYYLIDLSKTGRGEEIYQSMRDQGYSILYDDRDTSAGEKFADADLLGLPYRIVVSEKTLQENAVELKQRTETETSLLPLRELGVAS